MRKWGVGGTGLHCFLWDTHLLWTAIALSESQAWMPLQDDYRAPLTDCMAPAKRFTAFPTGDKRCPKRGWRGEITAFSRHTPCSGDS